MGNVKINKDIQVQGSTRSFDWLRSCVEYLMERDKSLDIHVLKCDISTRYTVGSGWIRERVRFNGGSYCYPSTGCKLSLSGNDIVIGAGVKAVLVLGNISAWASDGQSEFDINLKQVRGNTTISDQASFGFINGYWTCDSHATFLLQDVQEGDKIEMSTVSGANYEILNWSNTIVITLGVADTIEEIPEENTLLTLIQELQNYQPMWTEKQLFYSQNGTGSSFTLNESISNYDALEITCCTNDGYWYTWTQRVNRLNRSTIQVNLETAYPSGTMYYKAAHVVFSGTTATVATNYQYYPSGSVISGTYVLIQEVKGIKYNYSDLPASESIQELISLLKTTPGSLYNYSTSEQVIGTWINGKTLYRKVLTNVPFNTDSTSTAMGINNLDKILKIEGMVGERPLNFYIDFSGSIYFSSCWVYGNSLYTRCSAAYAGYGDVIIEYTKTTN